MAAACPCARPQASPGNPRRPCRLGAQAEALAPLYKPNRALGNPRATAGCFSSIAAATNREGRGGGGEEQRRRREKEEGAEEGTRKEGAPPTHRGGGRPSPRPRLRPRRRRRRCEEERTPLCRSLSPSRYPVRLQQRSSASCTASTRLGIDSPPRHLCPPRARTVSTTFASPFPPCAVRRERDAADEPTVGSRRRTRPFVSYRDLAVALVPPLQPGAAAERLRWCPADATAALRPR